MLESLAHPPMRPEEFQEPRWARFLFASSTAAWLWLVIRLYMASVFLPAGWEKITSGILDHSARDSRHADSDPADHPWNGHAHMDGKHRDESHRI